MIFFSCHPSTHTQRLLFFPAKWKECRVLAIDRWQKDRLPVVPEKGRKRKKKTTFCDIILISWVTSARVAFISFHMQILNITLRLVPENMECKNMDRDSVCFLICFFPLRIEEGRRRAHAASVCKRYYSWLNSTHNIRELNIYFLYMAKKIFFFRLPFSSSSPGFWGNYLWPYLAPLLVFFFLFI